MPNHKINKIIEDRIVQLYGSGVKVSEIAADVNKHPKVIYDIIRRNSLELRETHKKKTILSLEDKREIIEMYLSGRSNKEIADKFKINNCTIYITLKNQEESTNRFLLYKAPEKEIEIIKLYLDGVEISEISAQLNIHYNTIETCLKRNKIVKRKFYIPLTFEQLEFIKTHFPSHGSGFCAEKLEISDKRVLRHTKKLNLVRDKTDIETGFLCCKKCEQIKDINNFHRTGANSKKRFRICKRCRLDEQKEKRKNEPWLKIRNNISSRISSALKSGKGFKDVKSEKLVGCSFQFLKKYIQSKFRLGMSWENYGYYGWHIDHIQPCSSFDLTKEDERKKCFHYTNLRPLWATTEIARKNGDLDGIGNLNKNDKIDI